VLQAHFAISAPSAELQNRMGPVLTQAEGGSDNTQKAIGTAGAKRKPHVNVLL
jgi:hypothetical protein